MTGDALGGPRIAEVLLAEVVGRDLGPLADLGVEGLEHPARFSCEADETYTITHRGEPAAAVSVGAESVAIELVGEESIIRVAGGGGVKPALDELTGRLLAQ